VLFFVLGLSFAYFVMLPFALKYLMSFGSEVAKPSWNIREYYSFVFAVLLWIGASFETPLIMALLARLGMASPAAMYKQWRYAVVGVAIVAAVITPTVDPFNMALVMAPLLALYFLGIGMAKLVYRPRASSLVEAGSQG
jgi:sec-independent protein translocase protein TatC